MRATGYDVRHVVFCDVAAIQEGGKDVALNDAWAGARFYVYGLLGVALGGRFVNHVVRIVVALVRRGRVSYARVKGGRFVVLQGERGCVNLVDL